MKQLFVLTGFMCLIATLMPSCAPEPASAPVFDQTAEEAAIREADETYNDAWNAHDAEEIASTRDESEESWDGTIKHGEDDLKVLEAWLAGPYKNVRTKLLEEIGVVFVTPQVAIFKARFEWSGMVNAAGNTLPPTKMLYARVYVKKDGRWLGAGYFVRPIED